MRLSDSGYDLRGNLSQRSLSHVDQDWLALLTKQRLPIRAQHPHYGPALDTVQVGLEVGSVGYGHGPRYLFGSQPRSPSR
jgi:hypothetical protein